SAVAAAARLPARRAGGAGQRMLQVPGALSFYSVASVQLGRGSAAPAPVPGVQLARGPETAALVPSTVRAICRSRFQSMIGLGSGTPGRSRGTRTRRAAGWTVQRTGGSREHAHPA